MPLLLYDTPNARAVPWLTRSLALAQLVVLLFIEWPELSASAMQTDLWGAPLGRNRSLWTDHAYWPDEPRALSLLTGLFLHAGPVTALLGVFLLLIFGDDVEHHMGAPAFALLSVLGGVVGAWIGPFFEMTGTSPPVVGSGAAMGRCSGRTSCSSGAPRCGSSWSIAPFRGIEGRWGCRSPPRDS